MDHIYELEAGMVSRTGGWMCCHTTGGQIGGGGREERVMWFHGLNETAKSELALPAPSCSDHRPNPLGGLSRRKSRKSCNFKGYGPRVRRREGQELGAVASRPHDVLPSPLVGSFGRTICALCQPSNCESVWWMINITNRDIWWTVKGHVWIHFFSLVTGLITLSYT